MMEMNGLVRMGEIYKSLDLPRNGNGGVISPWRGEAGLQSRVQTKKNSGNKIKTAGEIK